MSDHIPFDLQVEIIKWLPSKSLLKFRAVSKPWKCLIDNAKFIADYNPRSQHLFVHSVRHNRSGFNPKYEYLHKCVKIIEDDTFPQHKFSLTVPSSCVNMYKYVIGYSHGLFCLSGLIPDTAVIWNPSIRKSVDIVVTNSLDTYFLGFGVCPNTDEPKVVKFNQIGFGLDSCEVEVFTLRSSLWRRPLSKLPDKLFHYIYCSYPVVLDGFIYWFASCDGTFIILSFDLTIEEFKHVYLPDKLAFDDNRLIDCGPIYKLRESLVVVQYELKADKQVCRVWMMNSGVSKSFTETFTINLPYASLRRILGFRNNGDLIMEKRDDDDHDSVMLEVCEPGSERINRLGISEYRGGKFFVSSYKESLLLHDHPY